MKLFLLALTFTFTLTIQAFQEDLSTKIHKADSLLTEQEYRLSASLWEEIMQLSSETSPQYALSKSKLHFTNGKLLDAEGNYAKAVEAYQKSQTALTDYKATPDTRYRIDIYNALYHALAYSGDWNAALEKGNEGLTFFNDTIDKEVRADYIYDLGYIHDRLGNYEEAISYYRKSIDLYEGLHKNMHFDLGLAYNNLATAYKQIGFFSERLKSFEKAQEHWEKDTTINPSYLTTLYGNLMKLYIEYGDQTNARKLFRTINKLSSPDTPVSTRVNEYRLKIIYHNFAGERSLTENELKAFSDYFDILSPQEKQQLNHHYLAALIDAGDYFIAENHYTKASALLTRALEIAKTYEQPYYQMLTHTKLARMATDSNQNTRAIEHLQQALAMRGQTDIGAVNVVNILIKIATLQAKEGLTEAATENMHEALSVLGGAPLKDPKAITLQTFEQQHSSFFVMALRDASGFYEALYDTTKNREDALNAQYLYELGAHVFGLYYQNGEYNTSLNYLNKAINEGLYAVHSALDIPLPADLLALIESNNSQVLRNEFEKKHLQFLNVEENTLATRNFLHIKLRNLSAKNSETPQAKRQQLADSIALLDSHIAAKEPLYHSFYNEEVTLEKIQEQLSEEELLIKYFTGSDDTYAITISHKDIKLFDMGKTTALREKLEAYYQLLHDPRKDSMAQSRELYSHLISPFKNELNTHSSVIIIPDDFLHYLPFEVLDDGSAPLIQSHEIQYANSLALWLLVKNMAPNGGEGKNLFAAFAPRYDDTETGSLAARGNRFKDIAGATKEARAIAATLNGDLFLEEQATVQNFMEHTTSYKMYHLAMHALLDEKEHTRSSLVFQDNGLLDFSALYGMYFPAELVVLSACNTGVGKLEAGEGLLSLSRALTYSGVRASVYSLWEVPDAETSEIMISFYNYLKAGENKATALAAAKKDFITNNPLKTHPYYWAGFVINGDTSPIATEEISTVWYLAGGILLIAGVFFFRRKRKSKASV
jgi:LPXTG-motif cell wall-anchored protein